jgi:hypothetical protein
MRLRCTTEAWLYRLAIRENSAASMTRCFGTHDRRSCATLSVPVFESAARFIRDREVRRVPVTMGERHAPLTGPSWPIDPRRNLIPRLEMLGVTVNADLVQRLPWLRARVGVLREFKSGVVLCVCRCDARLLLRAPGLRDQGASVEARLLGGTPPCRTAIENTSGMARSVSE